MNDNEYLVILERAPGKRLTVLDFCPLRRVDA
jgi:hypothetical protein